MSKDLRGGCESVYEGLRRATPPACWAWAAALLLLCVDVDAGAVPETPPRQGRGYAYIHDSVPEVPWSIHIFKLERGHTNLEFFTTLGRGSTLGMATVSDQIKTLPGGLGQPLAAINGDFYDKNREYEGRPRDLQIRQGELVSSPAGHASMWFDPAGAPHMTNLISRFRIIWPDEKTTPFALNEAREEDTAVLYTSVVGESTRTADGTELVLEAIPGNPWLPLHAGEVYTVRVREVRAHADTPITPGTAVLSLGPKLSAAVFHAEAGTVVRIATESVPNLTGVKTAISGGPGLVRDGKAMQWTGIQLRHPRTAIGWNQRSIFLVQVDGRQSDLSVGMTLTELAAYMLKLGCETAMNLDGGGSATLWVCGNVVNSPSEGRERPAANALVLVNTARGKAR